MTIQMERVATPEAEVSPEEAIRYLQYFVEWLEGFFYQISENRNVTDQSTGEPLFHAEQIEFLPRVLGEMDRDKHFVRLHEAVAAADPQELERHGLYGAQLNWKLSNINFSLTRFLEQRTAGLMALSAGAGAAVYGVGQPDRVLPARDIVPDARWSEWICRPCSTPG